MLDARTSGQIQDILHVLKKRRWQIVLPALFLLTVGAAFATIIPKKYNVEARIEVLPSRVEGDSYLQNPGAAASLREVGNAKEHIRSDARIKTLIELQNKDGLWPEWVPATDEEKRDIIDQVKGDLFVNVINRGGKNAAVFVDVTYSDVDERRALLFLRATCERWIRDVADEDLDRLRAEEKALTEEKRLAQLAYDEVSRQFNENAKQIDRDPTEILQGGTSRNGIALDPVTKELSDRRQEQGKLRLELGTVRAELEALEKDFNDTPKTIEDVKDVEGKSFDEQITQLELKKSAAEAKLTKITRSHTDWDKHEAEIQRIDDLIVELKAREQAVTQRRVEIPNPARTELAALVLEKKREVASVESALGLLAERINDLQNEHDDRSNTYEVLGRLRTDMDLKNDELIRVAKELYAKTSAVKRLEEEAGRPVKFSKPPTLANPATTPNPLLIILGSLIAGGAIGLGLAVVSEFGRNSYRTVSDLANVMTVPVLGAIEPIVTRSEIRQAQMRRAVVGLSTALLIGGLAWVTWMYQSSPERLPVEIQDAIEGFRLALR